MNIYDKIDRYLRESNYGNFRKIGRKKLKRNGSTQLVCIECDHKFKKKLGSHTIEVKCPKCGGYDVESA